MQFRCTTAYFSLRRALRSVCSSEQRTLGSFYEIKENRLQIRLRKGVTSKLNFIYSQGDKLLAISFFYNRKFIKGKAEIDYQEGSYSTQFDPDFSILVEADRQKHWLHFDAKYRLNMTDWKRQMSEPTVIDIEQELTGKVEDASLYQKSDLYKMHTYRDAILSSRGAYILFPATSSERQPPFVKNFSKVYRERYSIPSVGAFPLKPHSEDGQLNSLVLFLEAVFSNFIQAGDAYQEERGFPLPEG